ncbi:oxygen-independent coproporphyrinogen III oxidase [Flavobacterium sp.]|jgi:oxygen-independent coproporphyrinogen-3 oxidase|uniref:oxygen-independent coproporphyrinogen III oxidase n=1 Tax=Flavobacterium sp. TaxID=239 RepID=UPI0037C17C58
MSSLIQKYNVPGPRYTSYPTVPFWEEDAFSEKKWIQNLTETFKISNQIEGISLYIHLPFCESLCTFCGCNKRITKRHEVELPYIQAVIKEWRLYCNLFSRKPNIKEIHLGGGTPTFFSTENLTLLLEGIFETANKAENYIFSFEGHPNNTTKEHLQTLYNLGFRRVSFGVQDYSPKVQAAIHRVQSFHNVSKVTLLAKEIGYTSIGHDLIYGLPFQTLQDIEDTILKTKSLLPDRISFYSYAHVPWLKGNGQRGFQDEDIPQSDTKRQLYELGKKMLLEMGYVEIGMDHFTLPTDEMYLAFKSKTLHRNFMGYTASKTELMIGLGVSSISDSWNSFAQNEKSLETYYQKINGNNLPVFRGHHLTSEDVVIRQHILNLMCHFETNWEDESTYFTGIYDVLDSLYEMQLDGLLYIENKKLIVTDLGKAFVRNICMAFDLRLKRAVPQTELFSMTV